MFGSLRNGIGGAAAVIRATVADDDSGTESTPPAPRNGHTGIVKQTTVVHNQVDEYDIYIGREVPEHGIPASKWGNPFVMANDSDGERQRAIDAYRKWVVAQPELMAELEELRGQRLACWCAPKTCHGNVLVELLEQA
jgi:hypothetical protein